MRVVNIAVVREPVGPFELLNKRWIIDLDGDTEDGQRHGRSTYWTPACGKVEVRREDGLAIVVQAPAGDEYEIENAVLDMPDPAVLVVVQPGISRRTVKNMIGDVKCRDEQALLIVGARMPGVVCIEDGATLLVDCVWDDDGVPTMSVYQEE